MELQGIAYFANTHPTVEGLVRELRAEEARFGIELTLATREPFVTPSVAFHAFEVRGSYEAVQAFIRSEEESGGLGGFDPLQ